MIRTQDAGEQSFFGWLDYDERDAQRMREVFAAFDDKETIDSLGLGGHSRLDVRPTISRYQHHSDEGSVLLVRPLDLSDP